ncbi:hypothetical protein EJ063_08335 [Vibrio aquaticus]|uniref:Uncharacterized protein n=1 Tax=Vibrio aquaticus TaxID=2496559 RepID=A0A3S0N6T6_9VIBR|nr:hypothetical protein [Vibrio aquaticus]RTZ16942.1 hypothetical protein EJ063_08335 [Vibrio aquaticus]
MKNHTLEQHLAEADQPVKDFMADLLEALGKKVSDEQEPRLALRYFGAQLEIKLVSFDGH